MGGDVDLAFPDGSSRYGGIKELHPTKESIIEAQIDYWTCLKNEENSTHKEDMSMSPTFEGEIKGFNVTRSRILKNLKEYEKDKELAEKCGLKVEDIKGFK